MILKSESLPCHRKLGPKTHPVTYVKRISVVIAMILSAATFLHVNNHIPNQTFLSCDRPCHHLDWPMICRVKLTLEPFQSLSKACENCPVNETACLTKHCVSVDGQRRGILTANRQLPGPSIQVCENDILVVDVVNRLPGMAAAIHWRGQNQKETPCMDGVPLITQCPIPSYTTFQYKFRASAPGTHLWHSHSASDVSNGIFGSFIVRQPAVKEPHRSLYDVDDPDHVLLISQWHHFIVTDAPIKPALLLINGRGRQPNGPQVPLSSFTVKSGKKYRFRVGHGGGAESCPVTLSIENHSMLLIALDGHPIEARNVGSITLAKGERADFVLNGDKQMSTYYINVHETKGCGVTSISGSAILKYEGASEESNLPKINPKLLAVDFSKQLKMTTDPIDKCGVAGNLCVTEVKGVGSMPTFLQKVDEKIYLPINQIMQTSETSGGELEVKMNINNATFTYPPSPLLSQSGDVPYDLICSEYDPKTTRRCRKNNANMACECVHVRKIPLGSTVEIILLDQAGRDDLVFHLHGYSFYIVAAKNLGRSRSLEEVKKMDENNDLFVRNLVNPPLKDTVIVPKYGVVALRFKASNPGYWMLRDEHALDWTRGLDVIIQVGEVGDMIPPPQDFPKCGSFIGPDYFLI